MRLRVLGGLVLLALLALALPGGAAAEEGEKAPLASAPASFEQRLYSVHALLRGHPLYRADRGPYPTQSGELNDDANPLFGSEANEPVCEFDSVADLIEHLKLEPGAKQAFEQEGVTIGGGVGGSLLSLRGPPALHEQVAAWLDQAGRRALRTVLLDVAAFRGDPVAADRPAGVAGAVASGAWIPLGVVRMTLAPQGGGAARAGGVVTYLQRWDVEVASESTSADPIVGVVPEGLAVDVVSAVAAGDRFRLHLNAWWASPATWEQRTTTDGDLIEVPTVNGAKLEADVLLGSGTWTVLPASGRVVFAARLHVAEVPSGAEPHESGGAPAKSPATSGAMALRSFDVRALTLPVRHRVGIEAGPVPSNFTPSGNREPPEPAPFVPPDALVDLLKSAVAPESWQREGASIESVRGPLVVRNDEGTLTAVGAFVDELRALALTTTTVRATIVSLPFSSLPEWWKGLPEDVTKDGGAALLKRPGAQVVDAASVRLLEGQRLAALGGNRRSYVADYDVEIALNSAIGNPTVRSLYEGFSLDVEADRLYRIPAVRVGLRVDHSRVLAMRGVPTRHGTIECPAITLSRLRGEATVALGTTQVLGAWSIGDEIRFLLVTTSD